MSPFQRQLAITVVMSGLAGFLGVWVGVTRFGPRSYPGSPPLRAAIDEMAQRGLVGLTSQQRAQITALQQHYARQRTELRARIAVANVELATALAEDMGFGPAVKKSIGDLESEVGELQKQTVLYVLDLRAVLTPPQQMIFDEKVVAALMTAPS